jgi:hypothetical protein
VFGGAVLGPGCLECLDAGEQLVGVALGVRLRLQASGHQPLVAPPGQNHHGDLEEREHEHHDGQDRADDEQQDQVQAREAAVQDSGQGPGREDVAHHRVALQAHHQVAGGSAEEEAVRQLDQVVDESHGQAHVEPGSQFEQQVGAQER